MIENEGRQLAFCGEERLPSMTPDDFRTALQRVDTVEVIPLDGAGYSHALQMDENGKWRWVVLISSLRDPKDQLLTFVHELVHIYWDYWELGLSKDITPEQKAEHDKKEKLIEDEAQRFFRENQDLVAEVFAGFSPKKD